MRLVQVKPITQTQPAKVSRHRKFRWWWLGVILLIFNYIRPLPASNVELYVPAAPTTGTASLTWPTEGQAAIAIDGFDMLGTAGAKQPMATASIAKVITALCVLEKHPLKLGQTGPLIPLTQADVDLYVDETLHNGSRISVAAGEQLSEYQMLQGMMIPSANNFANSIAIWAFGSLRAYASYANSYVQRHGLVQTTIGLDASGFDPSTVSSAEDLARLGLLAQKNSVLMEIAGQTSLELSGKGVFTNYNRALGINGITGLKTGNNDQNTGALLFTADLKTGGKTLKISGSTMGSPTLQDSLIASEQLVQSVPQNLENVHYVDRGQIVGTIRTAWGTKATVTTVQSIDMLRWKTQHMYVHSSMETVSSGSRGTVGSLTLRTGTQTKKVLLTVQKPAASPTFWWRLLRL